MNIDEMSEFSNFTEKDYQSYINLLRLAFDAVLNAETLKDAKEKAGWAAVGKIHSGYGEFEITQAYNRIAQLERHNELLRAVASNHQDLVLEIMGARVGYMGSFGTVYSGKKFSTERIKSLYEQVRVAIDIGALDAENTSD